MKIVTFGDGNSGKTEIFRRSFKFILANLLTKKMTLSSNHRDLAKLFLPNNFSETLKRVIKDETFKENIQKLITEEPEKFLIKFTDEYLIIDLLRLIIEENRIKVFNKINHDSILLNLKP